MKTFKEDLFPGDKIKIKSKVFRCIPELVHGSCEACYFKTRKCIIINDADCINVTCGQIYCGDIILVLDQESNNCEKT